MQILYQRLYVFLLCKSDVQTDEDGNILHPLLFLRSPTQKINKTMDPPERTRNDSIKVLGKAAKSTRVRSLSLMCLLLWYSLSNDAEMISIFKVTSIPETAGLQESPFSRIALMGQFNYGKLPVDILLHWTNTMKKYGKFADVVLRGAFVDNEANGTLHKLRTIHKIDARPSPKTGSEGFFAPYLNMADYMKEMRSSKNSNEIDGVLYIHDDAIPNLKKLEKVLRRTKNQVVVGTDLGAAGRWVNDMDSSYEDPRNIAGRHQWHQGSEMDAEPIQMWEKRMSSDSYRIYPFGRFSSSTGRGLNLTTPYLEPKFTNVFGNITFDHFRDLESTLSKWFRRGEGYCHKGQMSFALDPEARPYLEFEWSKPSQSGYEGAFLSVPSHVQADFLYIPIQFTDLVVDLSRLMFRHKIWIECAFSIIVDQISRSTMSCENRDLPTKSKMKCARQSAVALPLCTGWRENRNTEGMIQQCEEKLLDLVRNNKLSPYYIDKFEIEGIPSTSTKLYHFGVYHPIKPGRNISTWNLVMESINGR